jgi:hypothetical protein
VSNSALKLLVEQGVMCRVCELHIRALQATNKVINARPMQVIEPPKAEAGLSADEVPDHSGPFTRLRRF